jgi:hypothetical protein
MNSRPTKNPRTAEQQANFDTEQKDTVQVINTAFMHYLAETGPFESWFITDSPQRKSYDELHVRGRPLSV